MVDDFVGRAILGGIGVQGQNVAFLVALAFAVAASANLPTILYSLFWRRFTTRGAVWSMYGGLAAAGRALRADIEATTDRLAAVPLDVLGADERAALLAALAPVASAIAASGVIRYPNPMGLPAFRE